jgi:hypothetical protein
MGSVYKALLSFTTQSDKNVSNVILGSAMVSKRAKTALFFEKTAFFY